MQQIADGLWTVPAPLTFSGLKLNTRMTVCRLSDGGLVLVAPVAAHDDLRASVDALGPVRALVAPNLMHHLYVGEWMAAYPDALSYGPPGLDAKRPELTFTDELDSGFDEVFGAELQRLPLAGMPRLNESLFLHHASDTLIATDFCFYMPEATGLTGLFASLMGIKKRTRCEPAFRILIKDKAAFRASIQPLRTMAIRHLSMCHHHVLSRGADEALQQVLDQLKVARSTECDGP
jgi:hypothetical protein